MPENSKHAPIQPAEVTDRGPMAADNCEHFFETRLLGGHPLHVRACILCRTPDWDDLREQADELYQWGWTEGHAGQAMRTKISAYDKPRADETQQLGADEEAELVCVDECGSCDACGMESFGTPAEGWREAARFLRRTSRDSADFPGAIRGARLIEDELRRRAEDAQQDETADTEDPTVCEGFRWIGQSFATCDRCGQPAWDHVGEEISAEGAGPFDNRWTVRPWEPGQADRIRAKWGTPADGEVSRG